MRLLSVRVAPGLRVTASSRGLRAHVGPRVARVHLGGGRAGVSTGAGPATFYTSLGASHHRTTDRPRAASAATASVRRLETATKADEAGELAAAIEGLQSLHRQRFVPAERPSAPGPPVPTFDEIQRIVRGYASRDISLFQRQQRAAARAWADQQAQSEYERLTKDAAEEQARAQAALDAEWAKLLANEPDTTRAALTRAYEDNEAPAAVLGIDVDDASIVVLVPDTTVLPERIPSVTAAGNISLRKATKTQLASLYLELVCGHVLVTAKEAFAVAPGLASVTAVAVRAPSSDVECILATQLRRAALAEADWAASATDVLHRGADRMLIRTKGVARQLVPLDLSEEPDIQAAVAAVDARELAVEAPGEKSRN